MAIAQDLVSTEVSVKSLLWSNSSAESSEDSDGKNTALKIRIYEKMKSLQKEPSNPDEHFVEPIGSIIAGTRLDVTSFDEDESPDPHGEEEKVESPVENLKNVSQKLSKYIFWLR